MALTKEDLCKIWWKFYQNIGCYLADRSIQLFWLIGGTTLEEITLIVMTLPLTKVIFISSYLWLSLKVCLLDFKYFFPLFSNKSFQTVGFYCTERQYLLIKSNTFSGNSCTWHVGLCLFTILFWAIRSWGSGGG